MKKKKKPDTAFSLLPLHLRVHTPLLVALASLKRHLQYLISEPIPVQAGDGHGRLLVVCHGNETESLALVGVEVTDHLDVCDCAEWAEHLPQDALVRVLAQIVDEDAPAGGGVARHVHAPHATHVIYTHWRKPDSKKDVHIIRMLVTKLTMTCRSNRSC